MHSRLYTIDPWQYYAIVEKKLLSAFLAPQCYQLSLLYAGQSPFHGFLLSPPSSKSKIQIRKPHKAASEILMFIYSPQRYFENGQYPP